MSVLFVSNLYSVLITQIVIKLCANKEVGDYVISLSHIISQFWNIAKILFVILQYWVIRVVIHKQVQVPLNYISCIRKLLINRFLANLGTTLVILRVTDVVNRFVFLVCRKPLVSVHVVNKFPVVLFLKSGRDIMVADEFVNDVFEYDVEVLD